MRVSSITQEKLSKAEDHNLLWLHNKIHQAASLDRGLLIETHLLVVQELAKRGLSHEPDGGFDAETAVFCSESLGLGADEVTQLALVKHGYEPARVPTEDKEEAATKVCEPGCSRCGVCSCASGGDEHVVKLLPVEKADEERIVLGIVLEPNEVDTQKDTIKRQPVITNAAHRWLAKFQDRGVQHKRLVNSKIEIYESYIAPVNLTLGGQKVKKGSWLLMYHILDDKIWKDIKAGKLTGFSIGGFARRTKI